jgi:1-deoxy-D-xylulose-5-phosphate reductoisomerase
VDWSTAHTWTFEPLDELAFPAVALAKSVGSAGLTFPAVMNAANEEAVLAFHAGRLGFTDIVDTVSRVVEAHSAPEGELSREVLFDADAWARAHAREVIATT